MPYREYWKYVVTRFEKIKFVRVGPVKVKDN